MRKLRVLMIEGSAEDAELTARVLREGGYELTWRHVDTAQAIEAALAEHEWDLTLMDVSLPHLNGLDALSMLRARDPDLPVIVVSGTVTEDFPVQAMKAGATDPVLKNNLVRLCPTVERELAEAEVRRANRRSGAELRERLAQQEAIATVGEHALRVTALAPLLDEAVVAVAQALEVEYCGVLELQPDDKLLLLRAGCGWKEGLVGRTVLSSGPESQAGYAMGTRRPVIVEDLPGDPRFSIPPLLRDLGVVSALTTIIGNPERPYGVLGAYTRARREFTHDDANFVQAVASILAGSAERLASEAALRTAIEALGAKERGLRALIVEDNVTNRKVALWHLEKLGFAADAVGSGSAALEKFVKTPYDVVMMGCRMPKLDGFETTRRMRQIETGARHARFVAMTAHVLADDRAKCLAVMDEYVSKPLRMDALVTVLSRLFGTRAKPAPAQAPQVIDRTPEAPASSWKLAPPAPTGPPANEERRLAASPSATHSGGNGSTAAVGEAALDAATMDSWRDKGDLLSRLIETFLKEAPEQMAEIAAALERRDGENAAIGAHNLKGGAATFGAACMSRRAHLLEQAADRGALDEARADLAGLRREWARVQRALEAERTALAS